MMISVDIGMGWAASAWAGLHRVMVMVMVSAQAGAHDHESAGSACDGVDCRRCTARHARLRVVVADCAGALAGPDLLPPPKVN